jgi:septal ring factor EnvC (AmiA/AmiB activator)
MAKTSSHDSSFDSCVTCATKYNKIRPSLCQCKHCSQSFCFDCMKDHNNDLQQNIAELSNLFNEVKQSINTKRQLIKNETIKSKEQLSEWLRKFIDNLNVEKAKIDTDIGNAEKEAQVTKNRVLMVI